MWHRFRYWLGELWLKWFGKPNTIPTGDYCYTPLAIERMPDGMPVMKIKSCPYYKHIEDVDGDCRLFGCGVLDQVKSCHINRPDDEDYCCEYHAAQK